MNKITLRITLLLCLVINGCISSFYEQPESESSEETADEYLAGFNNLYYLNKIRTINPDLYENLLVLKIRTNDDVINTKKIDMDRKKHDQSFIKMKSILGLEYFVSLEKLSLKNHHISDLSPLKRLEKLQYLCISKNDISSLWSILNASSLKYLIMKGNDVKAITNLCELNHLEKLDIRKNPVRRSELKVGAPIYTKPKLSSDRFYSEGNSYFCIEKIRNCNPELCSILEKKNIKSDKDIENLAVFSYKPNDVNDGDVVLTSLNGFSYFKNLQELRLRNQKICDLSPLDPLQKLRKVKLSRTPIYNRFIIENLGAFQTPWEYFTYENKEKYFKIKLRRKP